VFRVPTRAEAAARLRRRVEERGETAEYVGAILDGRMVGSASINVDDPTHPGSMARAVRSAEFGVSVTAENRGMGIGRALIRHLEDWAADHAVERITLNVSEANPGAIRLYRELGYREFDRAMLKRIQPR
jgi:GNAT superfamily N-acetyltransferase